MATPPSDPDFSRRFPSDPTVRIIMTVEALTLGSELRMLVPPRNG